MFSYFLSKRVKTEHWNELKDLMSCQALRQLFEKIMEEVPDEGCVYAFAIADLDNFKKLNDVLGHMWGDKALYEVVAIMKDHCRARQDVVCRLGGDEFVVFMRNIPQEAYF